MAGKKIKTGNRVRAGVVVKQSHSGAEDVQRKPDTLPKMNDMTLHPDTESLVVDFDAAKTTSTAEERIVSGIGSIFRPILKELIKGGIVVAGAASEFASETGEQFKDLLAEAKSELEKSQTQAQETDKTDEKGGQ